MINYGTSDSRRIAAPWILLPGGALERDALTTFSADGTLVAVETGVTEIDNLSTTEYHSGVLIPSMVNAHNHLELSYFEGQIPEGIGLVDFVGNVIAKREKTPVAERTRQVVAQDRKMWAEGTGAVGDISNSTFSLAPKAASKIHYHTFAEYFGLPTVDKAEGYFHAQTDAILAEASQLKISANAAPHSTYLVGEKIFRMANNSERVSIHFMETLSEVDFFDRKGGMYDFVVGGLGSPDFIHYGSHVERLIESLPRTLPMLLVHCTQMQEVDIARVMEAFDDVTFVLCPRSNYYIERCFPPAELLLSMGARVALGTDSLCSNTTLSLISEVEWLMRHTNISLGKLLSWATEGGAAGLGIAETLGKFKIGTKCGAVLIEGFAHLGDLTLAENKSLVSRRII